MALGLFLQSLSLLLYELILTRVFAIVLFAQFAHLAISLALLGIGIGATAVHIWPNLVPAEKLRSRAGHLALGQAALVVAAVAIALALPFTPPLDPRLSDRAPIYFERLRAAGAGGFVRIGYIALLFPIVAAPFVCGGVAFSAAFRHGRAAIGRLYAADLCGGALGCLLFIPLVGRLAGPNAIFAAAMAAAAAAAAYYGAAVPRARLGAACAAAGLAALSLVAARAEPLRVRHPAGFDERRVVYARWTPLARLAVWKGKTATEIVLDNFSRAELALDRARTMRRHGHDPFAVAYRLRPPGRVLIIGAGGGCEAHVAQAHGHRDITAVDVAGGIFDIMRERFRGYPDNPYLDPNVKAVVADGRSAAFGASGRYDVVGMLQPFYLSFSGVLSDAWGDRLLITREAFAGYLRRLAQDGIFYYSGRHGHVERVAPTVWRALKDAGVRDPRRHALVLGKKKSYAAMLIKREPFADRELGEIERFANEHRHELLLFPERKPDRVWKRAFGSRGSMLTDDHPYYDDYKTARKGLTNLLTGRKSTPGVMLHEVLWAQLGLLFAAGLLFIGGPLLVRGRREMARVGGVATALGYCACLGYGYLALEIVLIHKLVLFLSHPTYAVTLVLLVLLLSSGLGSLAANRVPAGRIGRAQVIALLAVLALGLLIAFVFAPLVSARLLGLPLAARAALTCFALAPLGFAMGMPFALGMRGLPAAAGEAVPWCWALNGWTSVVAGSVSVLLTRVFGMSLGFALALAAYATALALAPRLARVGAAAPAAAGAEPVTAA